MTSEPEWGPATLFGHSECNGWLLSEPFEYLCEPVYYRKGGQGTRAWDGAGKRLSGAMVEGMDATTLVLIV